jgi:hypothetical protein
MPARCAQEQRPGLVHRELGVAIQEGHHTLDLFALERDDRELIPLELASVVLLSLSVGFNQVRNGQVEAQRERSLE